MQGASTEEATQKGVEVYLTKIMSDGRFVNMMWNAYHGIPDSEKYIESEQHQPEEWDVQSWVQPVDLGGHDRRKSRPH